jgi:TIR domain
MPPERTASLAACGPMMPSQTVNVFVSYSHSDASLVGPVVRLLRVNKSLVFQDTDRIAPGEKWRDEIANALAESNLVVVFWCDHARRSTEVSSEWKAAIDQDKNLLPLLLDGTPLPPELEQFQWIDFRGVVGANHNSIDSRANDLPGAPAVPPIAAGPRRAAWYAVAGVAAILTVVLSSSIWVLRTNAPPPSVSAPEINPPELPLPGAYGPAQISWILLVLGVAIAVGTYFLWSRRRRAKLGKRIEIAEQRRENIERRIAFELEAEILRRTAST